MRILKIVCIFCLLVSTTLLHATKRTVSFESMEKRASIIVVAEPLNEVILAKKDETILFTVHQKLKGEMLAHRISIIAPNLSFDKGQRYLLFLNKATQGYHWILGNSVRPKATEENVVKIKEVIGLIDSL